jgi:hypothetical protein
MNALLFDVEIEHLVLDVLSIDPVRAEDLRRLIAQHVGCLLQKNDVAERRISGPQLDDTIRFQIPAIDPDRGDEDIAREVARVIVAAIHGTTE